MKQWMTVVPAAAVAVVASAVVALTLDDPSASDDRMAQRAALAQDDDSRDDQADRDDRDDARDKHRPAWRHLKSGPPTWVLSKAHLKDHSWKRKSEWQTLAPAQRGEVMERLAREHRTGMRAWKRCVADSPSSLGNDCERPLPPGIAKRDPAELG
jgi:hypothetical protein